MFRRWPKRDPNKYYYLVPNEVFNLGLSSHEIAVYNYLLRCARITTRWRRPRAARRTCAVTTDMPRRCAASR